MQRALYILLIVAFFLSITGCDNLIYDKLDNCPRGVNFNFYRQTPCETGPSYPAAIKQVRVFAFDQNNVLVEEYSANDVALSADYFMQTPFDQTGTFTFVAWGGENLSTYNFTQFTKGTTTKEDMFVSITKQANKVATALLPIYVGQSDDLLTLGNRAGLGTVYELVRFNMQELTNRVRIKAQGLSKIDEYSVTITDDNGIYDITGSFAPDTRFDYVPPVTQSDGVLLVDFTLMKLDRNRKTIMTITNQTTGEVIYSANLIEDVIMYDKQFGPPEYKLECKNDFNVVLVFDKESESSRTYMLIKATIDNWNTVYRPIKL